MAYYAIQQILDDAAARGLPLWETILEEDLRSHQGNREDTWNTMARLWEVMQETSRTYDPQDRPRSGLTGGDGARVQEAAAQGKLLGGPFVQEVIAEALRTSECNACMKRIVAAPTAGSCGVLPAVLIPTAKWEKLEDQKVVEALFVAAGFGQVVAARASIAGAQGGCQAEIGTASAMAAAALTYLKDGTPQMCSYAFAMALNGLLGLVCDQVAGLVEIPCVQRNVTGALNALGCADMALAGVVCRIPADEAIDAMGDIGDKMPSELRETGRGGLAATPTGKAIAEKLLSPLSEETI